MSDVKDQVIGFHHTGIVVPDIDVAVEFYSGMFGFELISEGGWDEDNAAFNQVVGLQGSAARLCMLKSANAYLELFEYRNADNTDRGIRFANEIGIRHLCFAVRDVSVALDQCVELGGSRINEPYAVPGGATAVYCRDPFGNLIELVTPAGRFPPPFTNS